MQAILFMKIRHSIPLQPGLTALVILLIKPFSKQRAKMKTATAIVGLASLSGLPYGRFISADCPPVTTIQALDLSPTGATQFTSAQTALRQKPPIS